MKVHEFMRYIERLIVSGLPREVIASNLIDQFSDDALPMVIAAYENAILPFEGSEYARCQDCTKVWAINKLVSLDKVPSLLSRVSPGELMPAGACPDCGALCQLEA